MQGIVDYIDKRRVVTIPRFSIMRMSCFAALAEPKPSSSCSNTSAPTVPRLRPRWPPSFQ